MQAPSSTITPSGAPVSQADNTAPSEAAGAAAWAAPEWLSRSELLYGTPQLQRLAVTNVLVVGLGGVGSFAAEFLAR